MGRLGGQDALFLHLETPYAQMHTLKLALLEPTEQGAALDADWARRELAERIPSVPVFRQCPRRMPLGIHRPEWVDDPTFDIERHLRTVTVPAPGGQAEVDETVARVCHERLPRHRPLWRIWVLDGLADGRIALLLQLHHAVADGRVAANQMLALAGVLPRRDQATTTVSEDEGTQHSRLLITALTDRMRLVGVLPALLRDTARALRSASAIRRASEVPCPGLLSGGPPTRFRRRIASRRSFATSTLDLPDVKAVARGHGVSVNDVLLATVGHAVRDELRAHGELPDEALSVGIPADTATEAHAGELRGNRWAFMVTSLGTHLSDPATRLRHVHDTCTTAKRLHAVRGALVGRWSDQAPGPLLGAAARVASRLGMFGRLALPTVIVSNVRGPAGRLELPGAAVSDFYSVGPLSEGVALNLTAWSYGGVFELAVLSAENVLADPAGFLERVRQGLVALADSIPDRVTAGSEEDFGPTAPIPPSRPDVAVSAVTAREVGT